MRQLYREFVVAKQRMDEDFDRDLRLAWKIALFQRQEKLPDLRRLTARKPPIQSDGERRATIEEFRGRHGLTSKRVRLIRRDVVH